MYLDGVMIETLTHGSAMTSISDGPGRRALASLVDYTVNRHG